MTIVSDENNIDLLKIKQQNVKLRLRTDYDFLIMNVITCGCALKLWQQNPKMVLLVLGELVVLAGLDVSIIKNISVRDSINSKIYKINEVNKKLNTIEASNKVYSI